MVHNFSIVEETFTTKLQLILITLNTGFDSSTSENFDKIGGRNPANHIYGFNIIPLWGTNSAIAHIRNAAIYASVGNYKFLVVTSRAPINIKSGEGAPGLVRLNIVWTQHRDGWRGINSQKTTAQLEHIDSIVDI